MTLHRRDMLIQMGSGILLSLFTTTDALAFRALFNTSEFPELPDQNNPSFDVFYRLSQWLTYREELDRDVAQRMFKVFQDEPWGKQHISRVYTKLKTAIQNSKDKTDISALITDKYFDDGESWFLSHLIYTWYIGIYYHDERPVQRITYEDALMFEAAGDWLPVPFLDHTPFGEWSKPPESTE